MRTIDKIVVHCSAGSQKNTAADIVAFHTSPKPKGNGWTTPGYHYFIEADGKIVNIVPEYRISNGVKGHNAHAINVCYAGGVDLSKKVNGQYLPLDNRTDAQKAALRSLLIRLRAKYPKARIYGHRDFAPKSCPSFDAKVEYADLQPKS